MKNLKEKLRFLAAASCLLIALSPFEAAVGSHASPEEVLLQRQDKGEREEETERCDECNHRLACLYRYGLHSTLIAKQHYCTTSQLIHIATEWSRFNGLGSYLLI